MAEKIGDAYVNLSVKDGQFNKDMGRAGQKTKSLGSAFAVAGAAVAAAAAGLIVAGKAVKRFADNEEAASKFAVVFGSNAAKVGAEMDDFATKAGRSSNELRGLAGNAGDVIKSLGLSSDEAATLSTDMTKLAVDVASFKNASDPEVIQAFTSALTGERESLKTLGIVIREADVKQQLLNTGVKKSGKDFTTAQKALATYQLLLERTTDAQGDAERTSGSLTNRMRFASGAFKDLQIEIGRVISESIDLPSIFGGIGDSLVDLTKFIQKTFSTEIVVTFRETIKSTFASVVNDVTSAFASIGAAAKAAIDPDESVIGALEEQEKKRAAIANQIQADLITNINAGIKRAEDAKKKEVDKFIQQEQRKSSFIGFAERAKRATLKTIPGSEGGPDVFARVADVPKIAQKQLEEQKKGNKLAAKQLAATQQQKPIIQ